MELRLLRYFLAVAREENITRAAKSLHIAQPSLSRQLMELEDELGKQLLIRGKRKITLTEEGIYLRKRAEEILMLCEKTEREISQNTGLITGEVSIAGTSSAIIAQAVSSTVKKYPNVRFHLQNGDAEEIEEALDQGTLDFGILLEPADLSRYDHLPLKEGANWGLFMQKDCPLADLQVIRPRDLKGLPLILPQRSGLQRMLASWAGIEIEQMHIIVTFDVLFNCPALLIKNGLGYALGLHTLIDTDESRNICFRPLEPPVSDQYGLVWKRYPAFSKAAEKFLEEVRRCQEDHTFHTEP